MENELDPKRENEEAIDTNEEAVTGRSDDEEEFEDAEDVDEEGRAAVRPAERGRGHAPGFQIMSTRTTKMATPAP